MNLKPNTTHTFVVSPEDAHMRIDQFLTKMLPLNSRSYFQRIIKQGLVTINDKVATKNTVLQEDDKISITIPKPEQLHIDKEIPQGLEIPIIFEDKDFLIINKPAGLLVHPPSDYNKDFTLVDWLIKKFEDIKQIGDERRPGIVHRLDKDTSGLMIITRNEIAHATFSQMFKDRKIKKTYLAVVQGHPERQGIIEYAIKRNPIHRNKMTYKDPTGRPSITEYSVEEYFKDATLIKAKPLTGRTHQIRIHCAAIGHPIIGDTVYGKPSKLIKRQALHAFALAFDYKGEHFYFIQEPPKDIESLIKKLKKAS